MTATDERGDDIATITRRRGSSSLYEDLLSCVNAQSCMIDQASKSVTKTNSKNSRLRFFRTYNSQSSRCSEEMDDDDEWSPRRHSALSEPEMSVIKSTTSPSEEVVGSRTARRRVHRRTISEGHRYKGRSLTGFFQSSQSRAAKSMDFAMSTSSEI